MEPTLSFERMRGRTQTGDVKLKLEDFIDLHIRHEKYVSTMDARSCEIIYIEKSDTIEMVVNKFLSS